MVIIILMNVAVLTTAKIELGIDERQCFLTKSNKNYVWHSTKKTYTVQIVIFDIVE
jgi:hypothetical protein